MMKLFLFAFLAFGLELDMIHVNTDHGDENLAQALMH